MISKITAKEIDELLVRKHEYEQLLPTLDKSDKEYHENVIESIRLVIVSLVRRYGEGALNHIKRSVYVVDDNKLTIDDLTVDKYKELRKDKVPNYKICQMYNTTDYLLKQFRRDNGLLEMKKEEVVDKLEIKENNTDHMLKFVFDYLGLEVDLSEKLNEVAASALHKKDYETVKQAIEYLEELGGGNDE